jgi:hypothetical protein
MVFNVCVRSDKEGNILLFVNNARETCPGCLVSAAIKRCCADSSPIIACWTSPKAPNTVEQYTGNCKNESSKTVMDCRNMGLSRTYSRVTVAWSASRMSLSLKIVDRVPPPPSMTEDIIRC